jgi:hypothetical protein
MTYTIHGEKRTCYELDRGLLGHARARWNSSRTACLFLKVVHPESIVDASVRCSIPEWEELINSSSLGGGRVGAIESESQF